MKLKNVLFLISIILIIHIGCKKQNEEPKYCWVCATEITGVNGYIRDNSSQEPPVIYCDKTEKEINEIIIISDTTHFSWFKDYFRKTTTCIIKK